jgi:hypothetical protein
VETTARPTRVTITTTDPKGRPLHFTAVAKHGVATFKNIAFKLTGVYTLRVTATNFLEADSDAFTVTAAAARRIFFTVQPSASAHDAPFTVQAELFDRFGNLAVNDASTATIVFVGRQKFAILSGMTSAVVSGGVVTFSNLSINRPARSYALQLRDGKLRATSKKFAIT